jgi:hypothetical protein
MTTVTRNDAFETDVHTFVTEASTLGLAPGVWPPFMLTDLGNGKPFVLETCRGDVRIYRQVFGCIFLHVLND